MLFVLRAVRRHGRPSNRATSARAERIITPCDPSCQAQFLAIKSSHWTPPTSADCKHDRALEAHRNYRQTAKAHRRPVCVEGGRQPCRRCRRLRHSQQLAHGNPALAAFQYRHPLQHWLNGHGHSVYWPFDCDKHLAMSDIAITTPAVLPARSLWRVAHIAAILALALIAALALIRIEECRVAPGAF